jgi:hypothetical protein
MVTIEQAALAPQGALDEVGHANGGVEIPIPTILQILLNCAGQGAPILQGGQIYIEILVDPGAIESPVEVLVGQQADGITD